MYQRARRNAGTSGADSVHPMVALTAPSPSSTNTSSTFTSGPAAMLQRVAPGRIGGAT